MQQSTDQLVLASLASGAFKSVLPEGVQAGVASDGTSAFRAAMRRHAAGVCILTVGSGETSNGMAVTSATSFSFDPPSMLVCVNASASIAPMLILGAAFGLTILGEPHAHVAEGFSRKPSGMARFAYGDWRHDSGQIPWLIGAPANLACVVERTMTFGSHTAIIGAVQRVHLGPEQPSLIYRDGRYG